MGYIMRYKVRLVAKNYLQDFRVNFNETIVLVAKFITIKTIVEIRAIMNFNLHHMHVKITFLNRKLKEDIYLEQPQEFIQ